MSAPPEEIAGAEAVAITLAQTRANGHELQAFNRRRHPRGRKPDHRSRPSGGCRRTAKKVSIRHSLEQWGCLVSERGRQLDSLHKDKLLAEHIKYSGRLTSNRKYQSAFGLSFNEFYRREQMVSRIIRPLCIYLPQFTFLFI